MKTDTIFYQLFQTLPSILFELIGKPATEADRYHFTSVEIKELAFRFDGLFIPNLEIPEQPIYFVEVQFQPKADFYWKLFTEIFVYLNQYQPKNDFHAVAIFAKRSLDPGVPMQYRGLLMSQQVTVIYLDELEVTTDNSIGLGMVQLVMEKEETAIDHTKQLIQKSRQQLTDASKRQKVLELLETILVYKLTNLSRQEIEAMFTLDELKQTRYFREVAEEAKVEGKLEGRLEGKLETVPLLLQLGLTVEQIAANLAVDIEAVRKVAEKYVDENPSE
ncbi:Rpn family recombination-promoting nuclease/putative transposase [Sphaerospermopsis aphanizomenoides BCCUSP55]|uniref:Rpn family recombination-promoting nuclease/putative transposase n=1 Tax=Sphaerospermopsis aphanizomenoides TaxID=459663 RepID=UPI0019038CAA|nr:Rpn family recombination-promoting nuclease/putative transposase [Sphaerospermopsis aphanizomenoides]MBK1987947.1 Rpn family recombination-promoting nuclease/putative transposase [Sphaerospermopsis aphanizomenoides BCCUSP55]